VVARPDTTVTAPLPWQPLDGDYPQWLRIPAYAHNYGLNDLFAYGTREAMLTLMTMRHKELMRSRLLAFPSFAGMNGRLALVNSESWLCSLAVRHRLVVGVSPLLCVVRVRSNGRPNPIDTLQSAPNEAHLPHLCVRDGGLRLHLDKVGYLRGVECPAVQEFR